MISGTSLLLVDDSPEIRLVLGHMLRSWGYEVLLASSGEEAWDLIQREQPRIVIADWVMPGMDGLGLCKIIRASVQPAYIYIILLTARNYQESLIQGMNAGADDFIVKPVNLDGYNELKARLRAGERIIQLWQALQEQNRRQVELSDRLAIAHERLRRELDTAGRMQRRLLPPGGSRLHGVSFEWLFIPSACVSGDMLSFFGIDEKHVGFYCIDVAGHGIAASMLSASLSQLLKPEMDGRSPIKQRLAVEPYYAITPPVEVMSELNRKFQIDAQNFQYFTMVYGLVNASARSLEISNAGMPYPIYVPINDSAHYLGDGGFPVGIIEQARYESMKIQYRSGDRLFICSDGVSECCDTSGEMFGSERILNFLNGSHDMSLAEVLKELERIIGKWHGGADFEDDVSVLGIEFP
jgi:sigma-B regulation protein RsbU (phosphoserine phosphatase)